MTIQVNIEKVHRSIARTLEVVSSTPGGREVSQFLTLELFRHWQPIKIAISIYLQDGSIKFIGDYGFEESITSKVYSKNEWQEVANRDFKIEFDERGIGWAAAGDVLVSRLIINETPRGNIALHFGKKPIDIALLEEVLHFVRLILSLYFCHPNLVWELSSVEKMVSEKVELSERELIILRLMAQNMTNNEIALSMGFSLSTIRHATMNIFRVLEVSSRKEAVGKAFRIQII